MLLHSPHVVAVIVNYNGANLTARAVASVRDVSNGSVVDILVVDSGSSEHDLSRLRQLLRGDVRLLELAENRGYGAACNAGIAHALQLGAHAVWLLNNDIVAEPGSLQTLVSCLKASPDTAAVMPAVVSLRNPDVVLTAGADVLWWKAAVRHRWVGDRKGLPLRPERTGLVEGSAMMVSADAIRDIGGFDEAFFMYWEDTEWSMRATRRGWQLLAVPSAAVRHEETATTPALSKIVWMFVNRYRFARLFTDLPMTAWLTIYLFSVWLPLYLATRVLPQLGVRGVAVAAVRISFGVRNDIRRFGFSPPRQLIAEFSPSASQPAARPATNHRLA